MGTLRVFDSQGTALYPKGEPDEVRMQQYFDQHIFALGPDENLLEFYTKVNTGERNEQVSVQYVGDNSETLFEDCRDAIRRELVENRGWTIREPGGNSPGLLSWLVVWEGQDVTQQSFSPKDIYTDNNFGLGLDKTEADILDSIAKDPNSSVRITAKDYKTIANILPLYLMTDETVVVSRERHSPPGWADVHFSVSTDQWEEFDLHSNTRQILDERKEQQRKRRQREALDELENVFERLSGLNADETDVKQRLSSALSDTYSELIVNERKQIRDLRQRARSADNSNRRQKSDLPWKIIVPLAVVVIIIIAVLIVSFFFSIPFIDGNNSEANAANGNDSEDTAANFTITVDAPNSVELNESADITVTVENMGEEADNQSVEFIWDSNPTRNESIELDANENETVSFEVPTEEVDEHMFEIKTEDDEKSGEIEVTQEAESAQSRIPESIPEFIYLKV